MYIPSEVWEIIFDRVQAQNRFTSGYDLLHASQACREFQEILLPTKCVWLFKEIFLFLLSPLEYQKRHVLPLRQVCKPWRKAVDHVLEHLEHYLSKLKNCDYHDSKFYHNDHVIPFVHSLGDLRALTTMSRVEALERILQPNITGQNIFPGGGVVLHSKYATEDYKVRFYNLLTEVLLIYGDKISYLEIEDSAYPALNFKQHLFQHLIILPNLKTLSLIIFSVSDDQFFSSNTASVTLPKLTKLEALKFTNTFHPDNQIPTLNGEFMKDLCLSFFPNNMHIKQFQIDGLHFSLPFPQYFKPVKDNIFVTDIRMKLYSDQEFDRLLSLLSCTNLIQSLTMYCIGGESYWKSGTQILDKLLSSLCARHFDIKTLRIFCTIPNTAFAHSMPESCIILRQLRQLERLHCFHLYGFTFMEQPILQFLPNSLSCLVLECVEYTKVSWFSRHTFCFPVDIIPVRALHEDNHNNGYYPIDFNIRPKEAWARFPQLKHIILRTVAERLDGEEDILGYLKVFKRPVSVGLGVRERNKECHANLNLPYTCLVVLILVVIIVQVIMIYLIITQRILIA